MQVIILGMHRAGTSAITRLINMMGAYVASEDQLLPATTDNPKGYWERIDVLQLHEYLLQQLNADWHLVSTVRTDQIESNLLNTFTERAKKIIYRMDGNRPWVMKDPRLCLFLPLWLPLLEVPVCIHITRHPVSVAQSLAKRDNLPLHFSINLWENYNIHALMASTKLPRFSISYEHLMAEPVDTVKMIYDQLCKYGVQSLRLPHEKEIFAFLDESLQHNKVHEDPSSNNLLNKKQTIIWESIRDFNIALDQVFLEEALKENAIILYDYENLLQQKNQLIETRQELAKAQSSLNRFQTEIGILKTDNAQKDKLLQKAHATHEEKDKLLQKAYAIHEEKDKLLQKAHATHEEKDKLLQKTYAESAQKDISLKQSFNDIETLRRLFENLQYDTQLAFDSLTWRLGFSVAEIGRKVGLLKRVPLVQNHITQIAKIYQSWQQRTQYTQILNKTNLIVTNDDSKTSIDEKNFNEDEYLSQYPDVRDAVKQGKFKSGYEHFKLIGKSEISNGSRIYIHNFPVKNNRNQSKFLSKSDYAAEIKKWQKKPLISIIVPVYNIDADWLKATIESVQQQIYPHWELCITDDCSTHQETVDCLKQISNSRIKISFSKENQGIAGASNTALALAEGEYIALLDHDDVLTTDALYEIVKSINEYDPDLIYSDEDKLTLDNEYVEPYYKPDYSPDLLLSNNYTCHLSVYRKTILDRIEGFRPGYDGSQDHDLVLRFLDHTNRVHHIPKILYHWRKVPGSTATSSDSKNYAWEAGIRAVADTLQRRGIAGEVLPGKHPSTYRVKRTLQGEPKVSIIIPFKDQPDLLRNCLDSILEKSSYRHFEILGVSNNSTDSAIFKLMEDYPQRDSRIRFIQHNIPFNYSSLNNHASKYCEGEHLLLLNNDTTVITTDWLEALLEHSQRPEVGAVGAKLYYPDDTIQHAGVIIGLGGVAGHGHRYFHRDDPGYFARLTLIQNVSAVTGACLMVKKSLYDTTGGLDEKNLAIAFNDIDFCLRLMEMGYLNVFTPYCELYHYESKSRGQEDTLEKKKRFSKEIAYMLKRHRKIIETGDPFYNPNLTLQIDDFSLS